MRKVIILAKLVSLVMIAWTVFSCSANELGNQNAQVTQEKQLITTAISGATVVYTITSDWGTGFTADVIINNNSGSAINGWNVTFSFAGNQTVTGFWNGKLTQSGKNVAVVNESFNTQIPNGGSTTFGFQATYSGANAKPANFVVNSGAVAASSLTSAVKSSVSSVKISSGSSKTSVSSKSSQSSQSSVTGYIYPDMPWKDTNGNLINAHAGSILYENGYYYWYGEDSKGWSYKGIHCYRSKDLVNWTDMGLVMTANGSGDEVQGIIQRPHVVYNSATKKYVCVFKSYPDGTYKTCYVAIALADSPTGPFKYNNSFLGASDTGSGDLDLYQNGADLYHICVARGLTGRPPRYAKFNASWTAPNSAGYKPMNGVQNNTEGFAVFKRGNTFYLLGSGSSGWDPNPARLFTSQSLDGPWTSLGNPCAGYNNVSGVGANLTFGGQSTFIIPIRGVDNQYIAMFDVWKPGDLGNSRYIWLPFRVNDSTKKYTINWIDKWNLSWFNNH